MQITAEMPIHRAEARTDPRVPVVRTEHRIRMARTVIHRMRMARTAIARIPMVRTVIPRMPVGKMSMVRTAIPRMPVGKMLMARTAIARIPMGKMLMARTEIPTRLLTGAATEYSRISCKKKKRAYDTHGNRLQNLCNLFFIHMKVCAMANLSKKPEEVML